MFDKNSLTRLIYSLFVAIIITMIVLVATSNYLVPVLYILKGMIAGTVIWLFGEVLFTLCERLYPKSIVPGYIVLVLLILVGTTGFGYIFGAKNIGLLVKMSLGAELCGIGITLFYRRKYTKELNENLAKIKNKL